MVNTEELKNRMSKYNISERKIAQNLGIHENTVRRKIYNQQKIYIHELQGICELLDIRTPKELKTYFELDFLITPNKKS